MRLPALQRCAVILKDVLGHSVEDVAAIVGCSVPAAKSALPRGRLRLRELSGEPPDLQLPLLSDADRQKLAEYVHLFQVGAFDRVQHLLAEDVRLDLVARLRLHGREKVSEYFRRYAAEPKWRFALGAVDGRSAMLVFDVHGPMVAPAHFAVLTWSGDRVTLIRDFVFAPDCLEAAEWARLD